MRDQDHSHERRFTTLRHRLAVLQDALTPPVTGQENEPIYYWHRRLSEALPPAVAQAQRDGREWAHVVQFEERSLADPTMAEAFRTLIVSLGVQSFEAELARQARASTEFLASVPESELTRHLLSSEASLMLHDEDGAERARVSPTNIPGVWLELEATGMTNETQHVRPMLYVYVGDSLEISG